MPANVYDDYASGIMFQLFFSSPMSAPTGLYVGLTSSPPTHNSFSEIVVGNYVRMPAGSTNNGLGGSCWTYIAGSGAVYNRNVVTFPIVASPTDWGWVSGAILADSPTPGLGKVVGYTTVTTPKNFTVNDQASFQPSGLLFRIS